tara:strand:- start:1550 stop:1705 length:156 start_codon:yes stop_codon:yes gene_type:complete
MINDDKTDDDKTDEYYKYWEAKGYEFVEGRTVCKDGFTKFVWIKRKIISSQ